MIARERIDYFLNDGTFTEFDQLRTHRSHNIGMEENRLPDDGIVTGYGDVNGRTVFCFAHDSPVFGGSLGEVFCRKVCELSIRRWRSACPSSA